MEYTPMLRQSSVRQHEGPTDDRALDNILSPSSPSDKPAQMTGPYGEPFALSDLPPPGTMRWMYWQKAELVMAVRGGLISLEAACER